MDWRPVMREVFMTVIRKNHPDFNPMSLNDFELLTLAGPGYKGLTVGIPAWLQKEWALAAPKEQDRVWVLQEATRLCNARMDVIGIKPQPGDPNAKVRKVTNSEYSIRLWPGPVPHWCLDFVHAQTLEPKNEPFDFELWAVPLADPVLNTAPWLPLDTISRRLRTMEYGFGIKDEDVKEGEAKFALMDGQTCVLKRPGERDIRFTVPNRSPAQIVDDTEVMNF
ncbi:hypothetical protein C8Q78DRAFT_1034245 [Trametes maxima]|nr:hypothetical protein C8Q78DRAFT_1034245 [Trametes maxima]